ncbi:MAG: hypothetical protein K0S26_3337 [Bacteroidota bacterium]|nr:hypothetical protein [Bacteroidota bacterium]
MGVLYHKVFGTVTRLASLIWEWKRYKYQKPFLLRKKKGFFVFPLTKEGFDALKQKSPSLRERLLIFVGVARFELTTSTSQMWRDTGLRYTPSFPSVFTSGRCLKI